MIDHKEVAIAVIPGRCIATVIVIGLPHAIKVRILMKLASPQTQCIREDLTKSKISGPTIFDPKLFLLSQLPSVASLFSQ